VTYSALSPERTAIAVADAAVAISVSFTLIALRSGGGVVLAGGVAGGAVVVLIAPEVVVVASPDPPLHAATATATHAIPARARLT